MRIRYKVSPNSFIPHVTLRPFAALREKFKEGYGPSDLRADVMSGIVVGMVAVPLGMALAIASGVAPQYGLYTVIIAGGIVALLGGSRFQVTGPTAAFVVILAPIVHKFGFGGLLIAGFLAGVMLVIMGMSRMGRLIQFIPHPVTTGFTAGIAVVIATLQLKDFFGLKVSEMPEKFLEKVIALIESAPTFSPAEFSVGFATLLILILWPKFNKKVPAPLVAISVVSIAVVILKEFVPEFDVGTIGNRFSFDINGVKGQGIPQMLPVLDWPWNYVGADGRTFAFSLKAIEEIIPSAFAIAMLGAIESLLSAVVADGMARTKHDPDAELVALGVGNMLCPFFGGVPATGAIARTATNIRFGARSPLSAVFHAVFTLLVILIFAPYVSYLPMAALAALLILVAYNMSELTHFIHILRVAPKSDMIVLLICFSLTVLFDMVVGVTVGVVLAALLFMRRMADVTEGHRVLNEELPAVGNKRFPRDVFVYEIDGPLFFGAAEKAAGTMAGITDQIKNVVFLMHEVPVMDVTGLVAFESAVKKLRNGKRKICLVGLRRQPKELILKSGFTTGKDDILLIDTLEKAMDIVSEEETGKEVVETLPMEEKRIS